MKRHELDELIDAYETVLNDPHPRARASDRLRELYLERDKRDARSFNLGMRKLDRLRGRLKRRA